MEEAIDHIPSSGSPEELAIHFLMRHTACRLALTRHADAERSHHAPGHSPHQPIATDRVANDSRHAAVPAPEAKAPPAEATRPDSCAARFSRAYAAARHKPTSRVA